ncbi:MAG: hypothetical protein AB8G16_19975 [Gammaproteobacteria bacterium]
MSCVRLLCFVLLFALAPSVVGQTSNIVISNLRDLDFGAVPPTVGSLRRVSRFCVGLDAGSTYRIAAVGSGEAGEFALSGGLSILPYTVHYSDRLNRRGRVLASGESQGDFRTRANINRSGCRRRTARITVSIGDQDLQAMPSGRYSGTLTLMVSPE